MWLSRNSRAKLYRQIWAWCHMICLYVDYVELRWTSFLQKQENRFPGHQLFFLHCSPVRGYTGLLNLRVLLWSIDIPPNHKEGISCQIFLKVNTSKYSVFACFSPIKLQCVPIPSIADFQKCFDFQACTHNSRIFVFKILSIYFQTRLPCKLKAKLPCSIWSE